MVRGRVGVTMSSKMSPLMLGVCGEFDASDLNTSPERRMNGKLILTTVKACSSEVLTYCFLWRRKTTTYTALIPKMAQSLSDLKTCCIYMKWVDCVTDKHIPHILEGDN